MATLNPGRTATICYDRTFPPVLPSEIETEHERRKKSIRQPKSILGLRSWSDRHANDRLARFRDETKPSPNDRLQVGVIGLGSRGYNLIDSLISHRDRLRSWRSVMSMSHIIVIALGKPEPHSD